MGMSLTLQVFGQTSDRIQIWPDDGIRSKVSKVIRNDPVGNMIVPNVTAAHYLLRHFTQNHTFQRLDSSSGNHECSWQSIQWIFQSGPKWWTNRPTLPSCLAASMAKHFDSRSRLLYVKVKSKSSMYKPALQWFSPLTWYNPKDIPDTLTYR